MSHYDIIIAELGERVPELAEECQPEIVTFLEQCQRGQKEPLLPADIEYLRELQAAKPDQYRDEINPPLTYIVFENSLRPFLIELLHDPSRHGRLQEILDWLNSLLGDEDEKVRGLVAIGICEALITNESNDFPALFPFLGENLRQSCRNFLPYFRVSEEIRHLLDSSNR